MAHARKPNSFLGREVNDERMSRQLGGLIVGHCTFIDQLAGGSVSIDFEF